MTDPAPNEVNVTLEDIHNTMNEQAAADISTINEAADMMSALSYFVELAKKHASDQTAPSPMEQVLEGLLADAAAALPSTETPVVECQVIFKDGSVAGRAVKRGPLPRTYIIGAEASRIENGRQVPLTGQMVELAFHGSDILRIATLRQAPATLLVPDKRIVMPG